MFSKIIHTYTRRTLVRDLTVGLALAVVGVLAVLSLFFYFFYTAQLERDLDNHATDLVEKLSGVLGVPLWNLETGTVEQIGAVYQQTENVVGLRILDETGRVVFESSKVAGAEVILKSESITYQDRPVGRVEISLTKQHIKQARQNIFYSTLIVGVSVILVIVVITQILLRRLLTQPLTRLAFGIDTIAAGNYTHLLPPLKQADIDFIAHRVNAMAGQIAERDGRLWELIGTLEQEITERKRAQEALNQRLIALTEPLETADISFTDLFNLENLQKIQDAFAKATQVASLITRPDGTPITQPSCFCRLCVDVIRQTDQGRANCFYSDTIIGRQDPHGPIIQPCLSGGLWDAGASLTVGGKHIANWLIGQVKNEAIDEENLLCYADEIGADKEEFRRALQEVPVMSMEQFQKVADALFLLATELSHRAYQNIQQARFITQRKQAEEELEKYRHHLEDLVKERTAALEEANAELSQYAYVVSHDLRAPLRAIHNYADFLREDLETTLDGDQKMYLNGLGQVVREAETLVEDLLELSRIGQRSTPIETVDLGVFLRELVASLKLPVNIQVVMGNGWPTIEAEPALLRQIFQNLIDNAAKFNTAPLKQVELGWSPATGEAYEFFVRDNGLGIAPHYQEQIFRVFERLHTPEEYEGTGVGLAIVKKAAGKLHGSIRLESEPGKGSTFFVTLPKSRSEPL